MMCKDLGNGSDGRDVSLLSRSHERSAHRLCLGFFVACAWSFLSPVPDVCSVRCLPLSIGLLCLVSPWFLSLAFLSKWLLSLASTWLLGLRAHWLLCLASI